MEDVGGTIYRRRRMVLAMLVTAAALAVLCVIVARALHALAPAVHALG